MPNNIGLIRLLLACAVIVSHSWVMIADRSSDAPLWHLLHRVDLGVIAVDGFFIISGYLITQSYVRCADWRLFFWRRAARILPGFIVAYLISVLIVAPLLGGQPWREIGATLARMLFLTQPPSYNGLLHAYPDFHGVSTPLLNGSMWTIAYEARCYVFVGLLGALGVLRRQRRVTLVGFGVSILGACAAVPGVAWRLNAISPPGYGEVVFGDIASNIRFLNAFCAGMMMFACDETIRRLLTLQRALLAGLLFLGVVAFFPSFTEMALIWIGAVLLHGLAFRVNLASLQRINASWDISYGTYLYAFPIQLGLRWAVPINDPWTLIAVCLPISLLMGVASWYLVERPSRDWMLRRMMTGRLPQAPG